MSSRDATAAGAAAPDGVYRAVLTMQGGDLPFGLELATENGQPVAYLQNASERVRATDVVRDGARITIGMPGYEHRIVAEWVDNRLEGNVVLVRPGGVLREVRMIAERGATHRFFPPASTAATANAPQSGEAAAAPGVINVAGRWAVTFKDDKGGEFFAIAELAQQGTRVTGTFLRATGDDRYIEGEVRGDAVFLSRFDGGSAYLYKARLTPEGTLEGQFWSGGGANQTWVGRRDANAKLEDPSTLTKMKSDQLAFTFPDLSGQPVSLSDARFQGKVVIVTIGGTWCPNCHDEAKFLQPFYAARKAQGLEVIGLMFEYHDDMAVATKAVQRFNDTFGITYPLLIAGASMDQGVLQKLPMVEKFTAYPTTFVLDRTGKIVYTHAGFSGPATGKAYDEYTQKFTKLIDGLLAKG